MSRIDWTAAGTIALAAATAVLAYFTYRASAASADMVEEVRSDRVLSVRPYMTFYSDQDGFKPPSPPTGFSVHAANYGRGPALKAFYCARFDLGKPDRLMWYSTAIRDFAPTVDLLGLETTLAFGDVAGAIILQGLEVGSPGYTEAMVCIDQFGARFRFRKDREEPDIWRRGEPLQGWESWVPLPPG